jgi:DNA-binding MarR family transcriptional regulator
MITEDLNAVDVADALMDGVGLLVRRLRQLPTTGALSMPERSALASLDRDGSATAAELARAQQMSPQSMGATLAALTERGLVRRDLDPADGRRVVLSVTAEGKKLLTARRSTRSQQLASAMATEFTPAELRRLMAATPLLQRLARSV